MEMLCFLDLEETVIVSWDDPQLINMNKLRSFFEENQITEIQIFSFAVSDEKDLETFNHDMKETIERVLNVKIIKTFTVEEVCRVIRKNFGAFWEPFEIPLVLGKQRAFFDVCTATAPKGSMCVLIDDVVDDISLENFTKNIRIRTINVDRM